MTDNTRWIKVPGPGQVRGEGRWFAIDEATYTTEGWEYLRRTRILPTHIGATPPKEEADQ